MQMQMRLRRCKRRLRNQMRHAKEMKADDEQAAMDASNEAV